MKNMFKTLAAVAMIALAASCSKDAAEAPTVVDETAKVSFTVELPGIVSRATNDGETAKDLYCAVYSNDPQAQTPLFIETAQMQDRKATISMELVADQTYDLVFWAQSSNSGYTLDWAAKQIKLNYTNTEDGSVEDRDAFIYIWHDLEVKGSINEPVELRRPFAQINVGLSEGQLEKAANAGFDLDQVQVAAQTYNAISVAEGQGVPAGNQIDVVFTAAANKVDTKTIGGKTYNWVSFNYVMPDATQPELQDIKIDFYSTTNAQINVPAFTNVPIERNHRTNILGDLLTDPAKFEVVILPGFEDDEHVVEDITIVYDDTKTALENGQILFDAIANATNDAVIHLTPGVYMGTDGQTSRYTIKHNITIEGSGEGVILAGQKYGRVLDCEDPAGATFTLKNVTVQTDHVWGAAVYAKNYVTVDMYNVKTVNAGTTAILLDACNKINDVHPGDQKTRLNAYGVTIENGDLVELNANPCNAYPTASPTEAYFTFDNACTNINVVQPQNVCINQGNNLFVNGEAIPVGYKYVNGVMITGEYTTVSTVAELKNAITAIGSTPKTIFLAAGTYDLGTSVQGWNKNFSIVGAGQDQTTVQARLDIQSGGSNVIFAMKNLTFSGVSANQSDSPIQIKQTNANCTFENCKFVKAGTTSPYYFMYIVNSANIKVKNCNFSNCSYRGAIWGTPAGTESDHAIISNNTFNVGTKGAIVLEGASRTFQWIDITGNNFGGKKILVIANEANYNKSYYKNINISDNTKLSSLAFEGTYAVGGVENFVFKNNTTSSGTTSTIGSHSSFSGIITE